MRKLTLDLDTLSVQGFVTGPTGSSRGTVRANAEAPGGTEEAASWTYFIPTCKPQESILCKTYIEPECLCDLTRTCPTNQPPVCYTTETAYTVAETPPTNIAISAG